MHREGYVKSKPVADQAIFPPLPPAIIIHSICERNLKPSILEATNELLAELHLQIQFNWRDEVATFITDKYCQIFCPLPITWYILCLNWFISKEQKPKEVKNFLLCHSRGSPAFAISHHQTENKRLIFII